MATGEVKWTAIKGSKVRYLEGGRRNGPDVLLIPLGTGLATEEAVWSAIITVGRAVAVDMPTDRSPDVIASFLIEAIDVLRLRHPHLAASGPLSAVALSAALNHLGALESLILAANGEEAAPATWAGLAALLPFMTLPTLVIAARQSSTALEFAAKLPRCRVQRLDEEASWPSCAHAICAWIDGGYRSVPLAQNRP